MNAHSLFCFFFFVRFIILLVHFIFVRLPFFYSSPLSDFSALICLNWEKKGKKKFNNNTKQYTIHITYSVMSLLLLTTYVCCTVYTFMRLKRCKTTMHTMIQIRKCMAMNTKCAPFDCWASF